MSQTAIAKLDTDWAIEQIANGAYLRDLAAQTGIDKRRLSEVLRKHPDYASAKESAIECQLDEAQHELRQAQEATDIARARECWRAATWRAEREVSHRWGQRQQVDHSGVVTVEHVVKTDLDVLVSRNTALQQTSIIEDAEILHTEKSLHINELREDFT